MMHKAAHLLSGLLVMGLIWSLCACESSVPHGNAVHDEPSGSAEEPPSLTKDGDGERFYPMAGKAWFESAKLLASDGSEDDALGGAVAVSEDIAVVGAPLVARGDVEFGQAYIFARDEEDSDNWRELAVKTPSEPTNYNEFGDSVAISEDAETVAVGARGDSSEGFGTGAVYVYERDEGGDDNFGEVAKVTSSDATDGQFFGDSVALDDGTLLVGASGDADGQVPGAAYVFEHDEAASGEWIEVEKLVPSDQTEADQTGASVAISGESALVGAPEDDTHGHAGGAVHVFERRDSEGSWGEVEKLVAPDTYGFQLFGGSVSVHGELAVIGAHIDEEHGIEAGAAYVFERADDGSFDYVTKLTASDASEHEEFGSSVSVYRDTIFVGADSADAAGAYSGAVYLFEPDERGDTFDQTDRFVAQETTAGDVLGTSVDHTDGLALFGASGASGPGEDSGVAHVFVSNATPEASHDQASVELNERASIDVLENDTDPDGDALSVELEAEPSHGEASVDDEGVISFTPETDYLGDDSLDYRVSDGYGAESTDTATVEITVEAVAEDDSETTSAGEAVTIDVLANDSRLEEGEPSVTVESGPANGTAEVDDEQRIEYTPSEGFSGEDNLEYRAEYADGHGDTASVTISVRASETSESANGGCNQTGGRGPVGTVLLALCSVLVVAAPWRRT